MTETKVLVLRCDVCGNIMYSTKNDEIEDLAYLYDAKMLECIICHSRKFTFAMKGKRTKEEGSHDI